MTIQSINAYTPSRPADPRLDRTWATKKEVQHLQEQIDKLNEHMNFLLNSKELLDNENSNNN